MKSISTFLPEMSLFLIGFFFPFLIRKGERGERRTVLRTGELSEVEKNLHWHVVSCQMLIRDVAAVRIPVANDSIVYKKLGDRFRALLSLTSKKLQI